MTPMSKKGRQSLASLFGSSLPVFIKPGTIVSCTDDYNMDTLLTFLWQGAVRTFRSTHDGKEMTTGI